MRVIKFRGKSIVTGKWIYGDLLHTKDGKALISNNAYGIDIMNEVDAKTIGQFTGCRDKKGSDIYEGDILRREWFYRDGPVFDNHGGIIGYNYERTGYIVVPVVFTNCAGFYTKGGYSVTNNPSQDEPRMWVCTNNRLKAKKSDILGNIHDNPELMKAPTQ